MPNEALTPHARTLLTGLAIGESPRWHAGRLWFCNWGTQEVVAVDDHGHSEVITHVPTDMPAGIDWLPDGRLLMVSGREARVLRQEPDGSLITHAALQSRVDICNEIVVDGRGNIYVNGSAFDPTASQPFGPGLLFLVAPDGSITQVADNLAFPNGMVVTPDNSTLIIAESYSHCLSAFAIAHDGRLSNRRVWAALGDDAPDGICLDAESAIWYADVGHQHCVRVREGGKVLQTVQVDRGCFACMLGGADKQTLFIMAAEWRGFANVDPAQRTGQVLSVAAPAAHAGWP